MSLLDPKERRDRGSVVQSQAIGRPIVEPTSLVAESWRDFIFAEVWTQTAMPSRARFLTTLASASMVGADDDMLQDFARGALASSELSLVELREAALHMGPYGGWVAATRFDKAVLRAAQDLSLDEVGTDPIRAAPWDPAVRNDEGAAEFKAVMLYPSGPPATPYLQAIHNFVFGEMWVRRTLDEPSRRWLTLVGVCDAAIETPVKSHIYAAIASGNCTQEAMQEFVLQFAVFHGWPKASLIQATVNEMIKKVDAGLPWNG